MSENSVKSLTTVISGEAVKGKVAAILGDTNKATKFVSALTSMINQNPALADCDQSSLINAALVGFSLDLSPQLQQYYVVPFKDSKNNRVVATYQMGWKGYWQLAMRTGQYKSLNVTEVKDGEIVNYDRLSGNIASVKWLPENDREAKPTIGYIAYFELLNGFQKSLFWDIKKMSSHAEKYSVGYRSDIRNSTKYTFWSKDFDGMAFKTMLRQIISKYGVMSVEMEKAYKADMAEVAEDTVDYLDNPKALVKEEFATVANKTPIPDIKKDEPITDDKGNVKIVL